MHAHDPRWNEGWVWWLRQHGNRSRVVYRAGDIWGCVGAWYSGDWHDGPPAGLDGRHYSLRGSSGSRTAVAAPALLNSGLARQWGERLA